MYKILTEYGDVRRLAKEFNTSEVTVRSAIKGKTKSILSQQIREKIINVYGRQAVPIIKIKQPIKSN